MRATGFEPVDFDAELATEDWLAGYWRGAQAGVWVGAGIGGALVALSIALGWYWAGT